jgi:Mn-dependent DtxR family transcriptional regulator
VVGLLITPAATAYLLCDRLDRMMLLSAVFGVSSVVGGLYLCIWLDSAGGGAIMLFCTLQFLVVLVVAPRYGMLSRWLSRRKMVPQQVLEDILATVFRRGEIAADKIAGQLLEPEKARRSIRNLISQGLLELSADTIRLTPKGKIEAMRIIRSHRLWEAYLEHVGIPDAEIHTRAERLEHMHDASAMNYLDELLGHPEKDPHGRQIPEDISCGKPGQTVPLSFYHSGRVGEVVEVSEAARDSGLKSGEPVKMLKREDDGRIWLVETSDGRTLRLDHLQADAIMVRCA